MQPSPWWEVPLDGSSAAASPPSFDAARRPACEAEATAAGGVDEGATLRSHAEGETLHRLREVREQQGVTLRTVSRRTGISVRQLREEEDPRSNLSLAALFRWQHALETPLAELLVEPDAALSPVIGQRAKLVRVMKTALSIRERARDLPTRRLAKMLCEQLLEVMPELAEQNAWPSSGTRRGNNELGRIAENPLHVDPPEL